MAPAAGTRDACPSGRSLLISSSPRRDHHISSRISKTKSFSFPQSSGCHHLPHCCQTMGSNKWMVWLALGQGCGILQLVSKTPVQNLSRARESSMTFLSCPQPFIPASQTLLAELVFVIDSGLVSFPKLGLFLFLPR